MHTAVAIGRARGQHHRFELTPEFDPRHRPSRRPRPRDALT